MYTTHHITHTHSHASLFQIDPVETSSSVVLRDSYSTISKRLLALLLFFLLCVIAFVILGLGFYLVCVCVCSCGFGFVLTVQVSNANNSFWFQSEFKWLHIPSRCMGFDLYFVFTFYSLGSVRWIIFTCSPNYKSNTTPLLYRYIVWFVKRMINLLWVAHVTSSVWAFFAFFLYGKWKK